MDAMKRLTVRTSSLRGLYSIAPRPSTTTDALPVVASPPLDSSRPMLDSRSYTKLVEVNNLPPLLDDRPAELRRTPYTSKSRMFRRVYHYSLNQSPRRRKESLELKSEDRGFVKKKSKEEIVVSVKESQQQQQHKNKEENVETVNKITSAMKREKKDREHSERLVPVYNTKSFEQYMIRRKGLIAGPKSHVPLARKRLLKTNCDESSPPRFRMINPKDAL